MNVEKNIFDGYICMWCNSQYKSMPKNGICEDCKSNHIMDARLETTLKADNRFYFIKISSQEVLNNMRKGNIWFQSPQYYQQYHDDNIIGDSNECALSYIKKYTKVESMKRFKDICDLQFKDIANNAKYKIVPNSFTATEYYADTQVDLYRLFCLYKCETDKNNNCVEIPDNRLRRFGDYFSIIMLPEFLKEIGQLLSSEGIDYAYRSIFYLIKKNYSGPYSPRCKFDHYNYQNEGRIILYSHTFNTYDKIEPYKVSGLRNMKKYITKLIPIELLFTKTNVNDWFEDETI